MQRKDVFWLILLRLIIITTLFISALSIQLSTSSFLPLNLFFFLFLSGYFLSLVYFVLYSWERHLAFQVCLQIVFDLFWITALVYISGGLKGSFYLLYIIDIIAASIILSGRAAYLTASLSAIFFGLLVDGMYFKIIPSFDPDMYADLSLGLVLNNIFIAWSAFFLVAFFINYLMKSLRKTRDELRLAQKELEVKKSLAVAGEMAAQLAHEIRNPLAAISGSVQVLRDEVELTGEQKSLMNIVVNESERVSQSIEQFLTLASPEKRTFVWIDLSEALKDTLILLQRSGEIDGSFRVVGNYSSVKIPFYGNSSQVKQIFWNLIKNAIKAMPEGGVLAVDFSQGKKNEIQIKFTDTGRGMPKETQDRLFEPFYSGFETGKGIGMTVVQRIVDEYEGKIQVFSEEKKGTEVVITFPQRHQEKHKIKSESYDGKDTSHR